MNIFSGGGGTVRQITASTLPSKISGGDCKVSHGARCCSWSGSKLSAATASAAFQTEVSGRLIIGTLTPSIDGSNYDGETA